MHGVGANTLIEEGMEYIIDKYNAHDILANVTKRLEGEKGDNEDG
jgi:hypothetical protein